MTTTEIPTAFMLVVESTSKYCLLASQAEQPKSADDDNQSKINCLPKYIADVHSRSLLRSEIVSKNSCWVMMPFSLLPERNNELRMPLVSRWIERKPN